MGFRSISCTLGCLLAGFAATTVASTATLGGSFSADEQMFQYTWTLPQASSATAYTTSYASGGFVPVLSLFDASGTLIASDGGDASCTDGRMADASTHLCNDAYLHSLLAAGSYRLVLTEFFNFPNGNYSHGFSEQGAGNFTSSVCGTSGPFWETDLAPCVQRSGDYSVTVTSGSAATPEPATAWLVLPVLVMGAYKFRKHARRITRI